jgi:hypothetical protein
MENIYTVVPKIKFFCLCTSFDKKKQIMNLTESVSRMGAYMRTENIDEKKLKLILVKNRFANDGQVDLEKTTHIVENMIENSVIVKIPSDHILIKSGTIKNEAFMERKMQGTSLGQKVIALKVVSLEELKRVAAKFSKGALNADHPFYISVFLAEKKRLNEKNEIGIVDKNEIKNTILNWSFKSDDTVNIGYKRRGFFKKSKETETEPEKKKECFICMGRESGLVKLGCDHDVCDICLREFIRKSLDSNIKTLLTGLDCPIDKKCGKIIGSDLLPIYLAQSEFALFDDKYINSLCINCPYCRRVTTNDLIENKAIICNYCNNPICCDCYGKIHKFGERCQHKINLLKLVGETERVNFCPYCYVIYLKDDDCERVKCTNCNNSFCFRCSADQTVINTHGNHFHRTDCCLYRHYEKIQTDSEFDQKCSSCVKNKTGCKLPGDYKRFCQVVLGVTEIEFRTYLEKNLSTN